jgi:hypothetical protein
MGKKLLSDDCDRIVLESFNQPDENFSDYYQNKIDEHFINDEKIIEKLKLAVNRWIDYYKMEVNKHTVGTNWNEREKAWEIVAEKDRYLTKILLFEKWNIQRKVDLAFIENQLKIIEEIERQIELKKLENLSYVLERLKFNSDNQLSTKKQLATGFQCSLNEVQIQSLFDKLKGKYIDINTNPDHFKAVFKTDPLPHLFTPVNWTESPVLLSYLIYKLKKDKKIKSPHHWQITGNCFNPKSNFRQLADGFQNTKSGNPKESDLIDNILKTVYIPLQ